MKIVKTIIFIFSIFLILALLSVFFPQSDIKIGEFSLRFPSIEQMLEENKDSTKSVDNIINKVEKSMQLVDTVDTARQNKLKFYAEFFTKNSARLYFPDNDSSYLFPFFDKLDSAEEKLVHIIHYGDSQIEGDRISGYLRSKFQEKFTGNGPGLLPLQQPVGAYSVSQTLSDTVQMYYAGGMMGIKANHRRYGAMAQVAQLTDSDFVKMNIYARQTKNFEQIKIFVGQVDNIFEAVLANNKQTLKQTAKVSTITWNLKKPTNSLSLSFKGKSEIYGINIDAGKGVSLSNIPMRGSEGTFFTQIEKTGLTKMLKELNTQLIILEFGGNALPALRDSSSVKKYSNNFSRQISLFKEILPESKIIVIGPTDMSTKIKGKLQTYTLLPYLVSCMQSETVEHGAAYWDIYGVMGGFNSMKSWVNHSPALAAPDYVHFTRKGAEKIAEIFWKSFMTYYNYRNFLNNKQIICD